MTNHIREKLVELLKVDNCSGYGIEDCYECIYSECDDCYTARTADHLIAHGVTVQEWIPVSERLPTSIINKVLVRCKNGYIGFGHYEEFQGVKDWYNLESGKPYTDWDLEDCESYAVTHWMPLPTPPKGE